MALFKRKNKSTAEKPNDGEGKQSTLAIVKDAYKLVKQNRPIAIPLSFLVFLAVWAIGWIIGFAINNVITMAILFFTVAFGSGFYFFTRQANKAAFTSIENQLGAAASVLMGIRKGVTTDAAVGVDRNQNMVHRSISRAGIVLVAEPAPDSGSSLVTIKGLLQDEKRKIERFLPDVPVTTFVAGNSLRVSQDSSLVHFSKLPKEIKKLNKQLTKTQVRELRTRIKAIGGLNMPIPKGPMPGFAGKMGNRNIKMPRR